VETIPVAEGLSMEEEKSFLSSVVEHFRLRGASMIIPATTNTIFRTYPDGATAAPYGTFIIDLQQPEETLWNNLHSKHRNVIRNAVKKGVEIQSGVKHMDTAYGLVRDTLKRSRLGFMRCEAFQRMVLGLGEHVKVMIARHDGAVQGCAVIPFSGHSAYYVYGGSVPSPLTGAVNLLHWEAIRLFRGLGVRRYDFVGVRINPEKGTKQDGLMMFKERFGGQLKEGYMWKCSLHRIKPWAYSIGVRVLRGGDIVDQEKHKLMYSGGFQENGPTGSSRP
jgi:lipid II:glycine glycyltransferase (peptidoglycan interpeptide bridge formation enzyme)